jgi:glutathione S-transferase
LEEAKADYTRYEIDLQNKPEWYQPKVNPASKVPAIAIGGPVVPADQPAAESEKITESLVLIELIADLYPDSGLLPKDPIERARARFFIDTVSTKVVQSMTAVFRGEGLDNVLSAVEAIQNLLPPVGAGKYAIGDQFTLADVSAAPFLGRIEVLLSHDLGKYPVGEGKKAYEVLQTDPKFARYRQYWSDVKGRKSFQKTFDEVCFVFKGGNRPD